ncbi:MAG: magnesium transporter [Kiritimatiellae bacterium]|nr:magnesium transporter [Kiritimatiellia bacterium]
MPQIDLLKDLVFKLAHEKSWHEVSTVMIGQHPADLAEMISQADSDIREHLFALIEENLKPNVLAELEGSAEEEVLQALTNSEISKIVEGMSPDDAADVIADLSDERSEQVLDLMEEQGSEDVRALLKYDEDTAGGIMTTDIVSLSEHMTVTECFDHIAEAEHDEPFYYAYTVDPEKKLTGFIGIWELLKIKDRNITLHEITHRDFISAKTDMDQEDVAKLMTKYDLTALPITNEQEKLVGRITADDVMDVIEEEASEDILRLAGSDDAELISSSPLKACKIRLPWLFITLVTSSITILIMNRFTAMPLKEILLLVNFVPIVMAMGGNTGIQSSTLVVRGLALGTIEKNRVFKVLKREITTGLIMGLFCGVVTGCAAHYYFSVTVQSPTSFSPIYLAFTVGIALFSAMTFAALYGAFVPIFLDRLNIDPAVASGPFVTSSTDVSALGIYYGIIFILLAL